MRTGQNAPTAPKMSSCFWSKTQTGPHKNQNTRAQTHVSSHVQGTCQVIKLPVDYVDCFLNCSTSVCGRENTIILKKIPTLETQVL